MGSVDITGQLLGLKGLRDSRETYRLSELITNETRVSFETARSDPHTLLWDATNYFAGEYGDNSVLLDSTSKIDLRTEKKARERTVDTTPPVGSRVLDDRSLLAELGSVSLEKSSQESREGERDGKWKR